MAVAISRLTAWVSRQEAARVMDGTLALRRCSSCYS